jgi:hypothetical protein
LELLCSAGEVKRQKRKAWQTVKKNQGSSFKRHVCFALGIAFSARVAE